MADELEIGVVTGSEIALNKDDDVKTRLLQATMSEEDDVQTIELMSQSGEDSPPVNDAILLIAYVGDSTAFALAVDDGIEPRVEPGEKEFYSTDGLIRLARLKFNKDKELECNGKLDNAVRFAELETAFNQLRDDHDLLVIKFNSLSALHDGHVHDNTTPGPSGSFSGLTVAGAITDIPSTADMSDAKVNSVLMPDLSEDI